MNKTIIRGSLVTALLAFATTAAFPQTQNRANNQNQNRSTNLNAQEANKEQLKVTPEEMQKEVTDANKASKIIGTEVRNRQNERVGRIKDVVLDVRSGKIAYAVLSVGGVLGAGDKLVALPLDALTAQPGEEYFLIDASKDRLSQSAGFSDNDWPNLDAVNSNTVGLRAEPNSNKFNTNNSNRQPATTPRNNPPRNNP